MTYEDIIVEKSGDVLEITLNRPEKLNAIREQTADEIMHAMSDVETDRAIVGVILQGSEKAFCAGTDTSGFEYTPDSRFDVYRSRKRTRKTGSMQRFVLGYTKPVITVIEGFALGGGLELAMVGDIIVCGEGAKLGLPEARIGMMPGAGGTQTLTRLVGKPLAKEMMWTGRRLSAGEAREFRLVNHVTPKGQALAKAREIMAEIGKSAPLSVMLIKQAVDRGVDMSLADGIATEGDISYLLTFSEDREEGLRAFREKRPPKFRGQ
jgi:enoyl-CoA hydratase/carnithine racemase